MPTRLTYHTTATLQPNCFYQLIDENGVVIEETHYGPWGRIRNPETWEYDNTAGLSLIHRGFTGHEMLPEFDLIHMNGRMYDPVLGRMLSPDNYVQDPTNPQNYNRYSYCNNNPLKYTDPDGEWFGIDDLIAAAIGGTVNLVSNLIQGNVDNFWEGLGYFGVGAAAGALGAGVGAGIGVAYTGGSFGAGFIGTAAVTTSSLGVAGDFASGFGGGFSSGLISGTGNSLMAGNNFGQSLGAGFNEGLKQGLIGGGIGGVIGGISAYSAGNHPFTGKPPYKDVSLKVPFVGQVPNSKDCLLANSEMLEKYYGGSRTTEDFREILEGLPKEATVSDYYNAAFRVMGEPDNALHIIRTMEVNKFPTTIITNEGNDLFHNATIVRVRMWTPNSKAVFWVHDPVRGANYKWLQNDLYEVIWNRFTIGGF